MTSSQFQVALPRREQSRVEAACESGTGWLHLCNGLDPVRDGGMVPSILGMTSALNQIRSNVTVVTPTPSRLENLSGTYSVRVRGPETHLEESVRGAEVVHLHGLWQAHTRRGARAARQFGVPYLIAAHGMAEPWALRHKRWKKRIYLALVEAKNLRRASCLHALSRPEISHLREIAPWTPICFVPNGVDLAFSENLPPRSVLERDYPALRDKFVLLFFGRIHIKKGLDILARSIREIAGDHPEFHLLLAGNDDGAWTPFREQMNELGLENRFTYVGHVAGERARQVWGAADAFVLPSYSEGFSMAILEALACRLPSLITTACHFPELRAAGGGLIVSPDAAALTSGLRDLLERTPSQRAQLGLAGRRLVEDHYTWARQAGSLAAVYRWLAGGGPPPEVVVS